MLKTLVRTVCLLLVLVAVSVNVQEVLAYTDTVEESLFPEVLPAQNAPAVDSLIDANAPDEMRVETFLTCIYSYLDAAKTCAREADNRMYTGYYLKSGDKKCPVYAYECWGTL